MIDWPLVAARFVHLTALMAVVGSSLFVLVAGGPAPRRWLMPTAAAAVLFSAVGWLVAAAVTMSGRPLAAVDAGTLQLVLTATAFGMVWRVQLLVATALAVAAWWRERRGNILVLALAALLLVGVAAVGHAGMAGGRTGLLRIANDALHLLAAAAWLGGLMPLAALLCRAASRNGSSPATLRALERFSAMAIAAVVAVLLTGAVNLQGLLGSPPGIFSDWGRVLTIKLVLAAALLVLATINRLILLPRLRRPAPGVRHAAAVALFRTVLLEQVVAVMVLTAASLLGTLPPPI